MSFLSPNQQCQNNERIERKHYIYWHILSLSILTDIFPGEPGLAGTAAKDNGSGGDNWSHKTCKAPVKSSPTKQINAQLFTGRLPCLTPNQQCRRTGENILVIKNELWVKCNSYINKVLANYLLWQWSTLISGRTSHSPQGFWLMQIQWMQSATFAFLNLWCHFECSMRSTMCISPKILRHSLW